MRKTIIDNQLFGPGVNSFTRFSRFLDIENDCGSNREYALVHAYDGSDNLFPYREEARRAFQSANRKRLMDKEGLAKFTALPEVITIYRGMTTAELQSGNFGISWSLRRDVAEFFAYTYARNYATNHMPKTVHSLQVNKTDVVAYLPYRNEDTIIYLHPLKVDDKEEYNPEHTRSKSADFLQAIRNRIKSNGILPVIFSID